MQVYLLCIVLFDGICGLKAFPQVRKPPQKKCGSTEGLKQWEPEAKAVLKIVAKIAQRQDDSFAIATTVTMHGA